MIKQWFSDPEDRNPSFLRMTRNILIFTILANAMILPLVSGLVFKESSNAATSTALIITLVAELISFGFVLRGDPLPAKLIVPISLFIAATYSAISGDGLHDISMIGFPAVIVIGALLLRKRAIILISPIAAFCVEAVAYADITGITKSETAQKTDLSDALASGVLIVVVSFLLHLLIIRLNETAEEARKSEALQNETNKELLLLQASLEARILERTRELDELSHFNERRAANFEAAARLARTVASTRDINRLLPAICSVIHESFNYYHVGIFLNDDRQEYTILTASNSKIGNQLSAGGSQIKINQSGFISSVARTGILRISQDRGQDPDSFEVSNYPETISEAAIPMKVENSILGVLDLHSNQANAFDSTAIDILSILADQIAIAIQNARVYIETQAALAESQILYGTAIKQAWRTTVRSSSAIGYRFTGTTPVPLEKPIHTREIKAALDRGEAVTTFPEDRFNGGGYTLAVPLKLRDEIIGVIHVKMPADVELGDDETDIVRAAAERVALSLENSTLLEESQRRALREQTIGQISARIGAGTEIETILKTTVRELGNQIGGAQILIEIGNENE